MSRRARPFITAVLLAGVTAGCTGHPTTVHHATASLDTPTPSPVGMASGCPRTVIHHVVGPPGSSAQDLVPGTSAYGNGKLVTLLNVTGEIKPIIRRNGSMWWKFPWWRLVRGRLTISGRRLDAPAPPRIPVVPNGYGPGGFQASGVIFPRQGCWQITGKLAGTSVTFVELVTTTSAVQ